MIPLTILLFAFWVILSGKFDAFHLGIGAAERRLHCARHAASPIAPTGDCFGPSPSDDGHFFGAAYFSTHPGSRGRLCNPVCKWP